MLRAALGSLVFFAVAPGTVVGLLPWSITRWHGSGPLAPLGWVLVVAGVGFLIHAFVRFVAALGTPAPIAPTRHLVVTGVYRYVRNPMYVAIEIALVGQALVFGSWWLAGYAVLVLTAFVSFVAGYEQPALRRTYGAEYDEYCEHVPGWIPRLTAWRPPG